MTIFSSNVLGALAAIFTALAAIFGLLAFGKSYLEAKVKEEAFDKFKRESNVAITDANTRAVKALELQQVVETELAQAKTRQAEAETKLEEVRKKQAPRELNMEAFGKALDGKPRCEVEILYQPNDDEAFTLASAISLGFSWASFCWEYPEPPTPVPIPEDCVWVPFLPSDMPEPSKESMKRSVAKMSMALPLVMRAGAVSLPSKSGVFIASNKNRKIDAPADDNPAYGALIDAFIAGGIIPEAATVFDLPDNKLRVIVGSKP